MLIGFIAQIQCSYIEVKKKKKKKNSTKFSQKQKKKILYFKISFHSKKKFQNTDLKPSNLLVTEDFHVKVADFGLTKMKDKTSKKKNNAPQGSPAYMAPGNFFFFFPNSFLDCFFYIFSLLKQKLIFFSH